MVWSPPGSLSSTGSSAAPFIGYKFLTTSEGNIASETGGTALLPF